MVQPATFADIRLIMGEQRSGKTETMVAFAKDDSYDQLNGIISPDGKTLKARTFNKQEYELYKDEYGVILNRFSHVRVFSGDESKIVKIPPGYKVLSPVRIFSNLHLYGLRYAYITLADIVQYLNSDLFSNAWILSDESVMTDARNSMTHAGFIVATLGATIGKRNLHFCQTTQNYGMIEKRFRLFATMKVLCTYEASTRTINLEIKKRGEPVQSVSYWAPLYWENFDTNELIKVPEKKLARAYESVA